MENWSTFGIVTGLQQMKIIRFMTRSSFWKQKRSRYTRQILATRLHALSWFSQNLPSAWNGKGAFCHGTLYRRVPWQKSTEYTKLKAVFGLPKTGWSEETMLLCPRWKVSVLSQSKENSAWLRATKNWGAHCRRLTKASSVGLLLALSILCWRSLYYVSIRTSINYQ